MKGLFNLLLALFFCSVSVGAREGSSYREDTLSSSIRADSRLKFPSPKMSAEQWDQLVGKTFPYAGEREPQRKLAPSDSEGGVLDFFTKLSHWLLSPAGKWLVWVVVALLILLLLSKWILPEFSLMLRRRKSGGLSPVPDLKDDLAGFDQPGLQLDTYVQAGDYRNATRVVYLMALHALAAEGWIQLRTDATDYDYYGALPEHELKPLFRRLLLQYHYAWFGAFPVSGAQWEVTRSLFNDIKAQLSK